MCGFGIHVLVIVVLVADSVDGALQGGIHLGRERADRDAGDVRAHQVARFGAVLSDRRGRPEHDMEVIERAVALRRTAFDGL